MTTTDINRILKVKGFSQDLDGLKKFQACSGLKPDGVAGTKTKAALGLIKKRGLMSKAQIYSVFGEPGDTKNLVTLNFPYPMRIAWDLKTVIYKTQCHKKVLTAFTKVLNELLEVYGYEELKRLGIDRFGGLYNFRKTTSGKSWSNHSWAIALDLDPERNTYKETAMTARFARPEYVPMLLIFYKHGFVSLGVEKDFDWMHMEFKV